MAFPLTFPTVVPPSRVHVLPRTATGLVESPFTFTQQVYKHPGKGWVIDVTLPPMPAAKAASFAAFFKALEGPIGTFTFNLTPYCPGIDPAPGTVTFRLTEDVGWDSELAIEFGFSFRAVEAQ